MLIQIFLDSLNIMGKHKIKVITIDANATFSESPNKTLDITKAATANAIPTP